MRDRPVTVVPMERLMGREVPRSLEAEMSLLGCMILDPREVIPDVVRRVDAVHFYSERHGVLFRAIVDVYQAAGDVDLTQLIAHLDRQSKTAQVGGADYLMELVNSVPTAVNAPHYAAVVLDRARLRRLIEACGLVMHEVYQGVDDGPELVARALDRVAELARDGGVRAPATLGRVELEVLDELVKGKPAMFHTGLAEVDRIADGVPRQGVWTIFGYPAGGKTTFALTVGMNLARAEGIPVRVVSFEQRAMRVAATLLSQAAGVNVHGMLNQGRRPTIQELDRLEAVARDHAGLDFAMFEDAMDPNAIFAEASLLRDKHERGVVIVDYLQDIPPFGRFVDLTPRITEAMRVLARIARELGWLVVVVSQLDKSAGKKNRQPQLSDGLGSSAIEQRSDLISYVWRPHQREPCPPRPAVNAHPFGHEDAAYRSWLVRYQRTRIGVIKNKYGPVGNTDLVFEGSLMRFRDPTDDERYNYPELHDEEGER